MNNLNWLLAPIFLHVALTLVVGLRTISMRITSVMKGETKIADIVDNSSNWPPHVKKWSNNFDNQFDVPTVWYALTALIVTTTKVDMAFVVLSWLFVATRLAHSYIHTGSNYIRYRMYAFLAGFAAVIAMWVWFALRLFIVG